MSYISLIFNLIKFKLKFFLILKFEKQNNLIRKLIFFTYFLFIYLFLLFNFLLCLFIY